MTVVSQRREQQAHVFPRNRHSLNSPMEEWPATPCIWHERKPGSPDATPYIWDSKFGGLRAAMGGLRGSKPVGYGAATRWVRFNPNSADRLLKWLNSLYRPALPNENRGKAFL